MVQNSLVEKKKDFSTFNGEKQLPARRESSNNTAALAMAEAEIKATIFVAQKNPRNEEMAFTSLQKSINRLSFAESALYSFPRGGVNVTGPSINFAKEFARCWGNIRYGSNIVFDDGDNLMIEGWAWDVETNTRTSGQASFQNLIYRKKDGWVKPDERDKRELVNKHAAIAIRNALLSLFPKDLIDTAMDMVKANLKDRINKENPTVSISKAITLFSGMGITVENLEVFLDKEQPKWTVDDIVELRNTFNSIKDGNLDVNKIKELKKQSTPEPKDDPIINAQTVETVNLDDIKEDDQGRLIGKDGKPI